MPFYYPPSDNQPWIVPHGNYMSPAPVPVVWNPDPYPHFDRFLRSKDMSLYRLGGDVRRAATEYQRWVRNEGWPGWEDDLDDVYFGGGSAAMVPFGAEEAEEARKRIRPFKLMSELFKKRTDTGKSRAEELVETAQRVQAAIQPPAPPPPPPQPTGLSTGAKVGIGVGIAATLVLVGIGGYKLAQSYGE